ncbi:MAG: hypothetical protein LAP39_04995 [Acidobacteriia bacterium]|nr:hypothetical protein [Terriglobia bacterium]
MPLPDIIRVKLSSEAAEYISLTPVVVQEMPTRELLEHVLAITGKDEGRIRELLLRGVLVSGASRFRWTGVEADATSLRALLVSFPDPDPSRPFVASRCGRAILRGPRQPVGIPREIGARRGFLDGILRRASFWDLLMKIAASRVPRYCDYSYRDRADIYQLALDPLDAKRVREASRLVRYTALEAQIRGAVIESVELYVVREEILPRR